MILFAGDPHGIFSPIRDAAAKLRPAAVVLLGDHDLEKPLAQELKSVSDAGIKILWIPGNHDGDRPEWHNNLFGGASAPWNIHGKAVQVGDVRIVGLGGVFRSQVWHPKNGDGEPQRRSRQEMINASSLVKEGSLMRWKAPWEHRAGLPLKHRVSIWPEDYDRMADLRVNILVSHEAPSCHRHGFTEIDLLAESMGAELIVHGHHHEDYEAVLPNGIRVIGVGLAGVRDETGAIIISGRKSTGKPKRMT